jgi:outer membrane protein OmpA-like peptidoglycan-associated protein
VDGAKLMKIINFLVIALSVVSLAACQIAEQQPMPKRVQVQDLRDDDGDGVANTRDICAATPVNSIIDNKGCAQWNSQQKQQDFIFEFDYDKAEIKPGNLALFPKIINLVNANPKASILIIGDTSSEGSDSYNRALGLRRADIVLEQLKQYGVDESTIVEFIYNDELLANVMKKRERRTIVRVVHNVEKYQPKWDIYTVESQRNEK